MIISIEHRKIQYKIDSNNFIPLSIPYNFNGSQPNFYNVTKGSAKPLIINNTIYSMLNGSSCNVSEINMNVHCTGTHTECVGHIIKNKISVAECIDKIFFPTILLTVKPSLFYKCNDKYHVGVGKNENVISKEMIKNNCKNLNNYKPLCIIVRTLPNPKKKQFFCYSDNTPPFFTNDAIDFICKKNIQHLIVDIPSIDRMSDNGLLGNHHIFWKNKNNISINKSSKKTITELAYIPNKIKDGFYFLNIELPHFQIDAAPSRPILFPII